MVSTFIGLFRLFLCFLKLLWLMFIGYIEWFDAAVLGFSAYLAAYHYKLPDNACIAVGIVLAILFLLAFKTRIGWWISTGVFSLMWAYLAGELATSLFHTNDIVRWVIIVGFFCYCVFLHSYAKDRNRVNEIISSEEAQARRPKEEYQSDPETQQRIKATVDKINRLAELNQANKRESRT
ncbi:hypothetical protein RBH76_10515 [Oscillospiraceae bacterium MB24-C1]|nr:hypothetical protein RBH76_10515 [Oscillospiraceae bacterium MB24-C1]